jgi:CubicO group peptidase (beta-lactamase class C family)
MLPLSDDEYPALVREDGGSLWRRSIMNEIQQHIQEAIDQLVESGAERGLQVAVYHNGGLVVDAVAGIADPASGRLVTSGTPFFSYSIGKGVAATVVHVLAGRGILDYDTPIVELWPEFGAHGKERATVRHALSQSLGVPGLPPGLTVEDLCDWDKMCSICAKRWPRRWGWPMNSSSPFLRPSRAGWRGWRMPQFHQRWPPRWGCRRIRRCSS